MASAIRGFGIVDNPNGVGVGRVQPRCRRRPGRRRLPVLRARRPGPRLCRGLGRRARGDRRRRRRWPVPPRGPRPLVTRHRAGDGVAVRDGVAAPVRIGPSRSSTRSATPRYRQRRDASRSDRSTSLSPATPTTSSTVRLREAGPRTPSSIRRSCSVYRPRPSLRALGRQFWWYGRWKARVVRQHPRRRAAAAPGRRRLPRPPPSRTVWLNTRALPADCLRGMEPRYAISRRGRHHCASSSVTTGATPVVLGASFPVMHGAWGAGFLLSLIEDTAEERTMNERPVGRRPRRLRLLGRQPRPQRRDLGDDLDLVGVADTDDEPARSRPPRPTPPSTTWSTLLDGRSPTTRRGRRAGDPGRTARDAGARRRSTPAATCWSRSRSP